jgi:hypothetical protein
MPSSAVAVGGNHAYVFGVDGLQVIDVSDPDELTVESVITDSLSGLYVLDALVTGDHLYVASDRGGLGVINVADPEQPEVVGTLPFTDVVRAVSASGDYAYLALEDGTFRAIDVSDPESPTQVDSLSIEGGAWSVVADGDYAYVANAFNELSVVKIHNPSDMEIVGSVTAPTDSSWDITGQLSIAGGHVYLSTTDSGVIVIDVNTPSSPSVVGELADLPYGLSTTVDGSWAIVFTGDALLKVDITDPETATISARMTTSG